MEFNTQVTECMGRLEIVEIYELDEAIKFLGKTYNDFGPSVLKEAFHRLEMGR